MQTLTISGDALRQLEECLLISYTHLAEHGLLVLVCDHWIQPVGEGRTFLKLAFSGVHAFERERGVRRALQAFTHSYSLRGEKGPVVFQSIERGGARSPARRLAFWFGPAFGGISFNYTDVQAHTRDAVAEKRGTDWEYRDAKSGERLDFYEPFGPPAAPVEGEE